MKTHAPIAIVTFLVAPATAFANDWFASPSGTGVACTEAAPCGLKDALCDPAPCRYAVQPGDTIWLRGGTYTGAPFVSSLRGTAADPIVVRQAPGERAIIDGNYDGREHTLTIKGSDAWYWGFEIFNSDPTRYTADGEAPPRRGSGILMSGRGTRLINMIVHDTSQSVLTGESAVGAEIYGNLFFYNGYLSPDRGHGHGIYAQNFDPTPKRFRDNIIFEQFGWGIHAYGEGGHLDNMDFEGNACFNNGGLSGAYHANILVGGTANVATNPKLTANYTYTVDQRSKNDLGYNAGCTNPVVTDNYFVNGLALDVNNCTGLTITGNTFYGSISGFSEAAFPSNTYFGSTRPTGVEVFIRPNEYEAKRANIIVYNWDLQSAVDVDFGGLLANGDVFEIRNAADFFGAPVLTGTYASEPISLPTAGLSVASPVGVAAPAATGPEFNVFVLLPLGSNPSPGADAGSGGGGGDDGTSGCGCRLGGRSAVPWSLIIVVCVVALHSRRKARR